jgi:hypothetical protein
MVVDVDVLVGGGWVAPAVAGGAVAGRPRPPPPQAAAHNTNTANPAAPTLRWLTATSVSVGAASGKGRRSCRCHYPTFGPGGTVRSGTPWVLMEALVIYESMFGNTRKIAEAIARGLGSLRDVTVVAVADAGPELLAPADLVVVGSPTHVHGLPRPKSRTGAVAMTKKPGSALVLEPHAEGPGIREWLSSTCPSHAAAAAFDTRMTMSPFLTGRASRRIHRVLRKRGYEMAVHPESFLVNGNNELIAGEEDRAVTWGQHVAAEVMHRIAAAA